MIKLGQKVKDKVTGFEGIVTARIEYLNGCIQFCVRPKANLKEGKRPEGEFIDEGQLVVTGRGVKVKKLVKDPGGEMSDTPSASYQG